jgi:hypothetical protein
MFVGGLSSDWRQSVVEDFARAIAIDMNEEIAVIGYAPDEERGTGTHDHVASIIESLDLIVSEGAPIQPGPLIGQEIDPEPIREFKVKIGTAYMGLSNGRGQSHADLPTGVLSGSTNGLGNIV